MAEESPSLLTLTADIVASYAGGNRIPSSELPTLIARVSDALVGLDKAPASSQPEKPKGAVSVRKSLADPNHIISMIDGKPYSVLTLHITKNGHTPQSYREAFGLPHDYPMTAPAYAEKRRELAKAIGLGRGPKAAGSAAKPRKPGAA